MKSVILSAIMLVQLTLAITAAANERCHGSLIMFTNLAYLREAYVGEEKGKEVEVFAGTEMGTTFFLTRYLTTKEREEYKVYVQEGMLTGHTGHLIDTMDAFYNMGIFVMDPMGQIFIYPHSTRMGEFHHSSLVAGLAVAAAGEVKVENGVLLEMTDRSGHYHPRLKHSAQAQERLKQLGADTSTTLIDLNSPF